MSETHNFIKNIGSNYVVYVIKILVGIYSLPVCLNEFGSEIYGIFLISFGLSTTISTFDFGSSKSIYRYAIEYNTDNNILKFKNAFNNSRTFNLIAAFVTSLIIIALGLGSSHIFSINEPENNTALVLFIIASINTFITMVDAIPQNLITANKLFHTRNIYVGIITVLHLTILLIIQFTTFISVEIYAALLTTLTLITYIADIKFVSYKNLLVKIQPKLTPLKELVHSKYTNYTLQVFLLSLISFLAIQADRLVIGVILDATAVTTYTIITKPYILFRGLISTSIQVVQPTLNQYFLNENKSQFTKLASDIVRVSLLITISSTIIIGLYYTNVLEIWLGTNVYNAYAKWGVLSMVSLCLTLFYTPIFRTLLNTNLINKILHFSIITVSINVFISIFLASKIGFQGVIIGTAVQIFLELTYFSYLSRKLTSPSQMTVFTEKYSKTLLIVLILGFIVYFLLEIHNFRYDTTLLTFIAITISYLMVFIYSYKNTISSLLKPINPISK